MRNIGELFGRSPFTLLVEHARRIHECVALVQSVAEAVVTEDLQAAEELHQQISKTEYEADLIKDEIRDNMPSRFLLPVGREDVIAFLRQMDRIGDDAEDFAVVATFRPLGLTPELKATFLELTGKVVAASEALLNVAEELAELQKDAFSGAEAEAVLEKIRGVCRMEYETDQISRRFAKQYYGLAGFDAVSILILDKLCRSLTRIADHAENVGKNLRLMISRR